MDLVNKKVEHGTFGIGKIVSNNADYIKVDFESGTKKFVFPDVFGDFMTLKDEESSNIIDEKLRKQEEVQEQKALELEREKELARQRQHELAQEKHMNRRKINPKLQSVFWCKEAEIEEVFDQWKIFIGRIKNGQRKGEPRKLARMNDKSACLLTRREPNMKEEDRHILGVFMTETGFKGNDCEDGYITAHPKYRLQLTKEESEQMLFWKYYTDGRSPERMTWNSGRQRYFDNIWMAQILRDIVLLREDPVEKEYAEEFFNHFCKTTRIKVEDLPLADGPLAEKVEEVE